MSAVYHWHHSDPFISPVVTLTCPRCGSPLSLHQPDSQLPDRLLATCDDCKSWFLADTERLTSRAALPVTGEKRESRGLTG